MKAKEFDNVLRFMLNQWSTEQAANIYNESNLSWEYSLGHHIYNKYTQYVEDFGIYGGTLRMLLELDYENLQKLIDYVTKFYEK